MSKIAALPRSLETPDVPQDDSPLPQEKPAQRASVRKTRKRSTPPRSKRAAIHALLRRHDGITLQALVKATGWQPHSIRGFLSRLNQDKSVTLKIVSGKHGIRRYRLVGGK
jgi:hypothetical protein